MKTLNFFGGIGGNAALPVCKTARFSSVLCGISRGVDKIELKK
jgi:hypothetical protein